jgi:hypothetical protein
VSPTRLSRKGTPTSAPPTVEAAKTGRYRVADNTQVNVAGELHPGGAVVELPESVARPWVARGALTAVKN